MIFGTNLISHFITVNIMSESFSRASGAAAARPPMIVITPVAIAYFACGCNLSHHSFSLETRLFLLFLPDPIPRCSLIQSNAALKPFITLLTMFMIAEPTPKIIAINGWAMPITLDKTSARTISTPTRTSAITQCSWTIGTSLAKPSANTPRPYPITPIATPVRSKDKERVTKTPANCPMMSIIFPPFSDFDMA